MLSGVILMKYKLLGNSGLKVSELCLGTMTFGTEWGAMGNSKEESKKVFEAFVKGIQSKGFRGGQEVPEKIKISLAEK